MNQLTKILLLFLSMALIFGCTEEHPIQRGCGLTGSDDPGRLFAKGDTCINRTQDTLHGPVGLVISLFDHPNKDLKGTISVQGFKGGKAISVMDEKSIIINEESWKERCWWRMWKVEFVSNYYHDLSFKTDGSEFYKIIVKLDNIPDYPEMVIYDTILLTIGKDPPDYEEVNKYYINWCPPPSK